MTPHAAGFFEEMGPTVPLHPGRGRLRGGLGRQGPGFFWDEDGEFRPAKWGVEDDFSKISTKLGGYCGFCWG